ncbi:MAG TPA: ABC transporter permease [Candidatus Xenobia bacterium]|jgi:simple sugar transport system permease protein
MSFLVQWTLRSSIPLILAALAGVVSERAGVVNLALEGLLLFGAFAAMIGATAGSLGLGIVFALAAGALVGWVLAVMAIRYKTDQIVTGFAFNVLAVGLTNFLLYVKFGDVSYSPHTATLPWQGFCTVAVVLVGLVHLVLYYTPLGLRIRAVGEHPRAADTLGVNVYHIRYLCVVVSGMLAALGGAYMSVSANPCFQKEMVSGRGYIALAAMIFGKWTPLGAMGAALFFGFSEALELALQGRTSIPSEFFHALPYLLTLVALVGLIGKAKAPAADGVPYDPSKGR